MTYEGSPVRRLSTASSVSKPPHYILTTQWLWYWRDESGKWLEYGRVSSTSTNTTAVGLWACEPYTCWREHADVDYILLSSRYFYFSPFDHWHIWNLNFGGLFSAFCVVFRMMVIHQPPSRLRLWRMYTWQTKMPRFLSVLANSSIFCTLKENWDPSRCTSRM